MLFDVQVIRQNGTVRIFRDVEAATSPAARKQFEALLGVDEAIPSFGITLASQRGASLPWHDSPRPERPR